MSEFITNDPILLAALQATESAVPTGTKSRGSSQYRGVSKNSNARSTTWSAATETGGKSYNLGTYHTEEEAALARNYGDDLLKHPKPVKNVIPDELMPDEIIQAKVARTVVMLLRRKGVKLPTASANGQTVGASTTDSPSAGQEPAPESKTESTSEPEAATEPPAFSEYEQKIQRLIDNP